MKWVKEVWQSYYEFAGNSLGASSGGWVRRLASEQADIGAGRLQAGYQIEQEQRRQTVHQTRRYQQSAEQCGGGECEELVKYKLFYTTLFFFVIYAVVVIVIVRCRHCCGVLVVMIVSASLTARSKGMRTTRGRVRTISLRFH